MLSGTKILSITVLAIAGVIGAIAGIWFVLNINEDNARPVSALANTDIAVAKDLDELARRSDYIIRGTVIKEDSATLQVPSGERGPVFQAAIIITVRVSEVIKGRAVAQITVGQTGIEDVPAPPNGSQVVLFLRRVDHRVARYPIPYDYFAALGPQAVFLIDFESNKTTPLGHKQAPTTERYQGAEVAQFLDEVRQAAARNPEPKATLSPPQN